ncbi:phosphatase PAP2 family protein [Mucilaginibacter rubeus]|uniref:Phosphatase PAP2 family protein n=1 Tax=Mucilaginibacter rubeus TaxID=2027860 RepID=A0AAE6JJM7_9SPHI|nr:MULTISPECIES: phosphatase PAP2 family protein [Mucilaginibacter]QEM06616.1 phosphatase PAP2 family protein [Mucilaginibacter rubeus]QEM19205.1 phosphatase PAP2 family protein [Mucilaginibacter gossypii]QTE44251.1 phosphatase PAP2 family protein [Mucilaginibacter rubeus]QTE50851.1 phosphatase PAP2 family protein [Mucilaginibacter rubeus]QTE55933.1 phosphatase PAP2 family protein [Mucilaginibacter rubeus]
MATSPISYPKTGLLLLFLLSSSTMLATIFYPYDKAIVIHLNQQRNYFWDTIFLNITNSAGVIAYGTVIVLLLSSFFIRQRKVKTEFYTLALAGIFSGLMVLTVKFAIKRIRPFHLFSAIHSLGPGGGWSYPSGHTSDAFFLATILWLLYPSRRLLVSLAYSWASLVGISRIYLGVHYLSDVLAAIAISSACSLAAFVLIQWVTKRKSPAAL